MMRAPHVNSLLDVLSSQQVEDLIDEHHLRVGDGYKFLYTVDNHDLRMYCFPGNIDGSGFSKNENGETNFSLETDYITAYEDFFRNVSYDNPLFFLDEYFAELSNLYHIIIEGINANNLFNYSKSFNAYYERHNAEVNIKRDFTLFISLVSGAMRNGAMRYNSIVKNEYFLRGEYDSFPLTNGGLIRSIFAESFTDAYDLSNLIHSKYFLKYTRNTRESKRKDSQAIARIIFVNKRLLEAKTNPRYLFLFLSTTPLSRELFHEQEFLQLLPKIELDGARKHFNFHRTAAQLFIKRLIKDLDDDAQLERLTKAKTFIEYREKYRQEIIDFEQNSRRYEEISGGRNMADEDVIARQAIYLKYKELEQSELSSFQTLMESYVNLNFNREEQFREVEKLFEQLTKSGNNIGSLKRLFRDLKENYERVSKQNITLSIENVESAFNIQYVFSAIFKKSMSLIHNGEKLTISRGEDPISGTGQHLPIVFINTGQSIEALDKLADFYLNQFAFLSKPIADSNYSVEDKLREITASAYSINSSSLDELLVFCLYLLILPEVRVFSRKSNNEHVQDFLMELIKREELESNEELHSDYLYVLVWVLRRNRSYVDAIAFTQKGIDLFPTDPRFYHSRFLINASGDIEQKVHQDGVKIRKVNSYLEDINIARRLYVPILAGKSLVVRANIEATLINSKLYSELLILSNPTETSKEDLRAKLATLRENDLRLLKEMLGEYYSKYPEFLHTESYFENMESDFETSLEKIHEKLRHASIAIGKAISQAEKLNGFKIGQYLWLRDLLDEKRKNIAKEISQAANRHRVQ